MTNEYFAIQDREGNYLSPLSFQKLDIRGENWMYISYTGRVTGFTTFRGQDRAEEVLSNLEESNLKAKAGKQFSIVPVDMSTIPLGQRLIEDLIV